LILLSFLTGPHTHPEFAVLYLTDYTKHFIMFFVASTVMCRVRNVWTLVIIFAVAIGYIAYEINYLYFVNGYLGIQRNGYGGSDNNGAGLLLALGVPMCYFVWEGSRRWWGWLFIALIPVIVHAVLMTYSRGAMVSLIACCPVFFLRSKRRVPLMVFTIAMVIIVPMLAGNEIRARFFSINNNEDESAHSRYSSWSSAWRITCDYPLFGCGLRGSNLLSHRYGADFEGRTIHNQYLQVFADNGFPAGVTYVAIILCTWLGLRRVRKATKACDTQENREAYASSCAIEGALVVFCTGAMFLSCEAFEAQYILILLGAQLPMVTPALVAGQAADVPEDTWDADAAGHWEPAEAFQTQPAEHH
jgi:probable O-glycosylation ligase (exosortase A-associated)